MMPQVDGIRVLPLWKRCLEQMEAEGLEYGKSWPSTFFAQHLSAQPGTPQYEFAIAHIRRELEHRGFYLSGRKQNGGQRIVPPELNAPKMTAYHHRANDVQRRAVILGMATEIDRLKASQRTIHERVLERAQIRVALMQRPQSIYKALLKKAPKLLEGER